MNHIKHKIQAFFSSCEGLTRLNQFLVKGTKKNRKEEDPRDMAAKSIDWRYLTIEGFLRWNLFDDDKVQLLFWEFDSKAKWWQVVEKENQLENYLNEKVLEGKFDKSYLNKMIIV